MAHQQHQPKNRRRNRGNNQRHNWVTLGLKTPAAQAILGACTISTDAAKGINCLGISGSGDAGKLTLIRRATAQGSLAIMPINVAEFAAFVSDVKAGKYDQHIVGVMD